ncbi:MAG TPA: hypothetical protein VIK64_05740 [Anaerolineales bacterium]
MADEVQFPLKLNLEIRSEAGMDADELDEVTRALRSELLELQLEQVDLATGSKAPPGTKSAEAFTIGTLVISTMPVFVPKLVEFLQSWVMRTEDRKVKIKSQVGDRSIELEYSPKAISQEELNQLIGSLSAALTSKP